MASRVNTKFVVVLVVVLVAVFGAVTITAVVALKKSGDDLAQRGDEELAAGNYPKAAEYYAKAVNKDQSNTAYLNKWISALEHITPDQRQAYQDRFFGEYLAALRASALADRDNAEAHRRYLDQRLYVLRVSGGSAGMWEQLINETKDMVGMMTPGSDGAKEVTRYRGIARVQMLSRGLFMSDTDIEAARADLEGALSVKPGDETVAVELARWHSIMGNRMMRAARAAEAAEHYRTCKSLLETFAAEHPPAIAARFELCQVAIDEYQRERKPTPRMDEAIRAARPMFEALTATILGSEAKSLDPLTVSPVAVAQAAMLEGGKEPGVKILEHLLTGHPDDAFTLLQLGRTLQLAGDSEGAIATYERVTRLPNVPLSLRGVMLFEFRTRAVQLQAESVLSRWSDAATEEEKRAVTSRLEGILARLTEQLGVERLEVKLLQAKVAYLKDDIAQARALLVQNAALADPPDTMALLLLGDILRREGNLGAAKEQYESVLKAAPNSMAAMMALAQIETELRNFPRAIEILEPIVQAAPENEAAARQLELARSFAGVGGTDPVLAAIAEAERAASGIDPDYARATAILRGVLSKSPGEMRATLALVQVLAIAGDRPGALAAVREGLATNPDNPRLKGLEQVLSIEDPLQANLMAIENRAVEAHVKSLLRYDAYRAAGKEDEANAELAKASVAAPDDPLVVEYMFRDALMHRKMDEARLLADKGARLDADQLRGLSFRARLEIMEGKLAEAASTLQQALEIDRLKLPVWRLLGQTRLDLKQFTRASDAYKRALEIRPTDVVSIVGNLRALMSMNQGQQALAFAREQREVASGNDDFLELWLSLESAADGGDRARALELRRQIAKVNPGNLRNRVAIVEALVRGNQWAEARAEIDALRAQSDSLSLADIDARWHAMQGNLEEAVKVYERYLTAVPEEKRTDTPYMALARLMTQYGEGEFAMRVLEQGRAYQDPKVRGVDREVASMHMESGRFEEALGLYTSLLSEMPDDPGSTLRIRKAQALVSLGRHREAITELDAVRESDRGDQRAMILRAEATAGLGDRTAARAMYDSVVAANPQDALCYYNRARFLLGDKKDWDDAESDLEATLRLQPRYWTARLQLTELLARRGQIDRSVATLRDAVSLDPDDDTARTTLISYLLRRNRPDEAVALANEAVQRQPENLKWKVNAGAVYGQAGRWQDAALMLARAWEQRKDPGVAIALADALLNLPTPDVKNAAMVMSDPSLAAAQEAVPMLMMRARVFATAGQHEDAARHVAQAFALVDGDSAERTGEFFGALGRVYSDAARRLSLVEPLRPEGGFKVWVVFNLCLLKAETGTRAEEAVSDLTSLVGSTEDKAVRWQAYRLLSSIAIREGNNERAVEHFRAALTINPNDAEMNNNLAYTLSESLNRPDEALPFALKAAEQNPTNANILDTLAAVYLRKGDLTNAEKTLDRAMEAALNDVELSPLLVQSARLKIRQKNPDSATRDLDRLARICEEIPGLKPRFADVMTELRQEIEGR